MKLKIKNLIRNAVKSAHQKGDLPSAEIVEAEVEEPKADSHGDFSTNIAMVMASAQKMPPRKIAQVITGHIQDPEGILEKTEIAGPGFINFFLNRMALTGVIKDVLRLRDRYGNLTPETEENLTLEYVSANPTGPLHVGHGRGAAYGASLGNILECAGHKVQREYYVNDNGRQMDILAVCVWLRYL
ncbi:MAG: arginine--tRNA ligase, partial [Desulfobacterales bacterium]|nr:arginine--tRNA ligase [Desulfobacterales bacterium]